MWVEAIKSYRGSIGMILSCRIQFHINQQSYTIQNTVKTFIEAGLLIQGFMVVWCRSPNAIMTMTCWIFFVCTTIWDYVPCGACHGLLIHIHLLMLYTWLYGSSVSVERLSWDVICIKYVPLSFILSTDKSYYGWMTAVFL